MRRPVRLVGRAQVVRAVDVVMRQGLGTDSIGKQVASKKIGCPVTYHMWLINGRWLAGQTCGHMGHGVAAPDRFIKLTPKAKAAASMLWKTQSMGPMST